MQLLQKMIIENQFETYYLIHISKFFTSSFIKCSRHVKYSIQNAQILAFTWNYLAFGSNVQSCTLWQIINDLLILLVTNIIIILSLDNCFVYQALSIVCSTDYFEFSAKKKAFVFYAIWILAAKWVAIPLDVGWHTFGKSEHQLFIHTINATLGKCCVCIIV